MSLVSKEVRRGFVGSHGTGVEGVMKHHMDAGNQTLRMCFCSPVHFPASTWLNNSFTPNSRDLMPSSGLFEHCMHVVHRHTCKQNIQMTHKIKVSRAGEIGQSVADSMYVLLF